MDVIAIKAAKNGSPAGFDGRVIYVRSAGEEACLGKDAPTNAQFDVTDEHKNPINTERYSKEDGYMAEARRKAELDKHTALHARSIREAVEMASDGDKILLLRGIHNGAGETVCVTKRVWIKGEGALLSNTILRECKGPGVDCSNNARCLLSSSQITKNVGGIWAWDSSSVTCVKSLIDGGHSHALVFDGHSSPTFSDSVVGGVVHASEKSWKGIRGPNVTITKTERMTQWPSEDGAFKFSPNPYTRKQ